METPKLYKFKNPDIHEDHAMLTIKDFEQEVTRCTEEGHALVMRSCGAITRLYLYGRPGAFQLAQDSPGTGWELVTPEESRAYHRSVESLRIWVMKQARTFPFFA
jgi:hypothetical protein